MEHLDSNCPLISFEREIAENIPAVLCDNYQGGILAANRLFDAGCRNIAIFNPPTKENIPAYSREKAFMKCCEDKKISGRVVYISTRSWYRPYLTLRNLGNNIYRNYNL